MKKAISTERDIEAELEFAWKVASADVYKRKNPLPEKTKDFRKVCIATNIIIPVAKLMIGVAYLEECYTNKYVPIYLVAGGVIQLVFMMTLTFQALRHASLQIFLGGIMIIWFLIASINIFVEWEPDYFKNGWRYCNKFLFLFAFFVSIFEYVIMALLMLFICIIFSFQST